MELKAYNSFWDYLFESNDFTGDFLIGSENLNYLDIEKQTKLLSQILLTECKSSLFVPIVSDNSSFFVIAYLSCHRANLIPVPIDPRASEESYLEIVRQTKPEIAFIYSKYTDKIKNYFSNHTKIIDEKMLQDIFTDSTDKKIEHVGVKSKNQPALLLYTSGSTGLPKGVMLSLENLISNSEAILKALPIESSDIQEMVLPFFYSFGLSVLHTILRKKAKMVINNRFLFPSTVIKDIQDFKCTIFSGVPSHFQILAKKTDFLKTEMPSLRMLTQAGGRMPPSLALEIQNHFPEKKLYLMYGATEATARLSVLDPKDLKTKATTIGKPIEGVEFQIRKNSDKEDEGQLWVKGPGIMLGYFQDEAYTNQVIQDGWFYTGDLAKRDTDGFFTVSDRERDFIKSGGYRVSSKEVEDVIMHSPVVVEAAVVAMDDELLGESILAYVVLKQSSDMKNAEQSIKDHCAERLPPHKQPKNIRFLDTLPKNAAGKIIKVKLLNK